MKYYLIRKAPTDRRWLLVGEYEQPDQALEQMRGAIKTSTATYQMHHAHPNLIEAIRTRVLEEEHSRVDRPESV